MHRCATLSSSSAAWRHEFPVKQGGEQLRSGPYRTGFHRAVADSDAVADALRTSGQTQLAHVDRNLQTHVSDATKKCPLAASFVLTCLLVDQLAVTCTILPGEGSLVEVTRVA